jgi:reverse gyrase
MTLPADIAAVIMAAAASALAESDTIPANVVAVVGATVRSLYPNATAIHITRSEHQGRVRRVRYRKRPAAATWTAQGRVTVMESRNIQRPPTPARINANRRLR